MFKKIAQVTALALTALTGTSYGVHAGTRDMSVINATAKTQIFMGLGYYKNHCAVLPTAAGEVFDQLEQMTGEMDQKELNKMKAQMAVVVNVGSANDIANLCNELEPTVQKVARAAEQMPVTEVTTAEEPEEEFEITLGKKTTMLGNQMQNLSVKNNGDTRYAFVWLECGFYDKGELVGTGSGIVANLYPNKVKYASVTGLQVDKANKVVCNTGLTQK